MFIAQEEGDRIEMNRRERDGFDRLQTLTIA